VEESKWQGSFSAMQNCQGYHRKPEAGQIGSVDAAFGSFNFSQSGAIWSNLEQSGAIWSNLEQSGAILAIIPDNSSVSSEEEWAEQTL
jgi:hypothetical protein